MRPHTALVVAAVLLALLVANRAVAAASALALAYAASLCNRVKQKALAEIETN